MSNDPAICEISNFGGSSHPYGYCIKPLDEMIDHDILKQCESNGFNCVTETAGGFLNYATSLVSNPVNAIASECKGILGNKYLIKTNRKCKSGETLYEYVDNTSYYNVFTQRYNSNSGIIPAAIGSATKINGLSLVRSLVNDPNPECKKVKVQCHLVDKTNSNNNYNGLSNCVNISTADYSKIKQSDVQDCEESFTNLYESINNHLNNNKSGPLHASSINKLGDDFLINMYFLLFSLFLVFVVYKLQYKK